MVFFGQKKRKLSVKKQLLSQILYVDKLRLYDLPFFGQSTFLASKKPAISTMTQMTPIVEYTIAPFPAAPPNPSRKGASEKSKKKSWT